MNDVIVTTPEQLREIISEEVQNVLPALANFRKKNERTESDRIPLDVAVEYLTEQGIPTSKSALYNRVFTKSIPYQKIGRRVIFSRKELDAWIQQRTTYPDESQTRAAMTLAASARNKKQ
ncbi:helix-turn-helix domain-containing protein [Alistipes sp.]|uniref:helix-turn-helix domain-containing protein n=1 Tax=Alistipes sp. TaxID=1872444 RepID=UPI003AB3CC74